MTFDDQSAEPGRKPIRLQQNNDDSALVPANRISPAFHDRAVDSCRWRVDNHFRMLLLSIIDSSSLRRRPHDRTGYQAVLRTTDNLERASVSSQPESIPSRFR